METTFMETTFKDLYDKKLNRKVNPAVSASDLSNETILTEIQEYVFTHEIIINLYKILLNIKKNQGSHVGIWINGYYGSGKSHFLKYASYCLSGNKEHRELAFKRFKEATNNFLLNNQEFSKLDQEGVSLSKLSELEKWYIESAKVEMVLFNIGDVYDAHANNNTTFTKIFWNQFNAKRGYNSFNLALAQFLEKALDEDGKFQEFKDYVAQKGFNWEQNITRFAAGSLDKALEFAKEVDPALAIDAIREQIVNNRINISVESFAKELKEYLNKKNDENYRIIFFVDEISQFIGTHRDLILQLQSLVTYLNEECESRVWIGCTAQQTLEDVVNNINGRTSNPEDEVGKILGRFEVRASLLGTTPEYITQKRILEKKADKEIMLKDMFVQNKTKLDAQFILPTTYQSFKNKEDFAAFYPFVPYQFQLIMRVLDSFLNMGYVDRQVRGNERSLLNITFSIAKETADCKVGEFVPFDRFFNAMFQGSMQHLGQRAIANAREAVNMIQDEKQKALYQRVMYILFMICNLSEVDKQSFSATIDNIVTLLMTKIDDSRAAIKNDIVKVLEYFIDKSVIRKIKTDNGTEIYDFYSEEESKVAQLIKSVSIDQNTYIENLKNIIFHHFGSPSNKEIYATKNFNIGINIDGRSFLSNNADIVVDILTDTYPANPDDYAFSNANNHLVFFLHSQFQSNNELKKNFMYYCCVQKFMKEPVISEERQRTKKIFEERALNLYNKEILPKFQEILDTCPVLSGQNIITDKLATAKKQERYKNALKYHFENLYPFAMLVTNAEFPKRPQDLETAILRKIDNTLSIPTLSTPEQKVKDFLDRQSQDITVHNLVDFFDKAPYGWSEIVTIYIINELVRRREYTFNYNNNPNVSREEIAKNIIKSSNRFTIEKAKAIPQQLVNEFIEAWRSILNQTTIQEGNDSTELFRNCKDKDNSTLKTLLNNYKNISTKIASYPFVDTINEAIELMTIWTAERDPQRFFQTVIDAKDEACTLFDRCKEIISFINDHEQNYRDIFDFIKDNNDNFNFLTQAQQNNVDCLLKIKTEKSPWQQLPTFIKLKRIVEGDLTTCKKELINTIKDNYNKVFDDLEEYAQSVNVDRNKFAKRDITIEQKTNSKNFYVLKDNANTNEFLTQQLETITQYIPKPASPTTIAEDPTYKTANTAAKVNIRFRKAITLNTQTTKPLKNEADVDLYLQGLKAEIMQHIGGDVDIMIN